MPQMQEPERQSYNEAYPESAGYRAYQGNEQADWSQYQYASQQKLRPENEAKLGIINYVMAIMSVVASALIMALSVALVALTANIFGRTIGAGTTSILPNGVFGIIIAGFVVSLILLLCAIAGFVFATIQLSIMQKKLKKVSGSSWSNSSYRHRPHN